MARNVSPRRAIRPTRIAPQPRFHRRRRAFAGPRYRRQHRHFFALPRAPAAPVAGSPARGTRHPVPDGRLDQRLLLLPALPGSRETHRPFQRCTGAQRCGQGSVSRLAGSPHEFHAARIRHGQLFSGARRQARAGAPVHGRRYPRSRRPAPGGVELRYLARPLRCEPGSAGQHRGGGREAAHRDRGGCSRLSRHPGGAASRALGARHDGGDAVQKHRHVVAPDCGARGRRSRGSSSRRQSTC
jgi:hypothetical protein